MMSSRTMTGASQIFFRSLKYNQISRRNSIPIACKSMENMAPNQYFRSVPIAIPEFFMEVCNMMSRMRIITILLLLVLPVFLSDCTNTPPPPDQTDTAEAIIPTFKFTKRDTMLVLTFPDSVLGKLEKKRLSIHGYEIAFNANGNDLEIPYSKVRPGLNDFVFYYTLNNKEDSIAQGYFIDVALEYTVLNTFRHNNNYFTQGFLFDPDGSLIEGTGLEGRSKIMRYHKAENTFRVRDSVVNASNEFGEGIAIYHNQLVQLLWQNRYIKIYDPRTLKFIRKLDYSKEGWGICTDGETLYASDGSNMLHIINIDGPAVNIEYSRPIVDEKGAVLDINELEFANGYIFANIWRTDKIYVIDPSMGRVAAKLDLTAIANKERMMNGDIDVLNGIAYNPVSKTYFVTGKNWSNIYELQLKPLLSK